MRTLADHSSAAQPAVLIVKRDRSVADFLFRAVRSAWPLALVECVGTVGVAVERVNTALFRLVLMGLSLPDVDGLDLIRYLFSVSPTTEVLVVSGRNDANTCWRLSEVEVAGWYDTTTEPAGRLVEVIGEILHGKQAWSKSHVDASARQVFDGYLPQFTPAEARVFAVLGGGDDDKSAGKLLRLSHHTVHAHKAAIMRKLRIDRHAMIVRLAAQSGVVRFAASGQILYPGMEADLGRFPWLKRQAIKRAS